LVPLGLTDTEPVGAQARERWASLVALVQLTEELLEHEPALDLQGLLRDLAARAEARQPPTVQGVTLASLHAAKGLEWDAVFLVGLTDGTLPITHVTGDKDTPPDEPADKIYNEGVFLLNEKKDLRGAAKKFEEVDRQHPYSEWARKGLLMSAYTSYEAGKYDEAIAAGQRYLSLHPGTPDAAYAQFIVASSYYDRIPDPSRDQEQTEKALLQLNEVVRKYPDTEYAVSARRKMEVARDQLAAREMAVFDLAGDEVGAVGDGADGDLE